MWAAGPCSSVEAGRPGREAWAGGRTPVALDLVFSQLLEAVDSYEDGGACAVCT